MTIAGRGLAALALSLAATGAVAECFTEADLGRGIQFVYPNGDVTKIRRLNTGHQEVIETYVSGANPLRFLTVRGIYFLQEFQIDEAGQPVPGTRLDIEFPEDPMGLPVPAPGVAWQGSTVNVFDDGGQRAETTIIGFSAGAPVTLSGCTYDTVRADLRYDWGMDGGLTLVYHYLPALGTAFIESNQFDGDVLNAAMPVAIEAQAK